MRKMCQPKRKTLHEKYAIGIDDVSLNYSAIIPEGGYSHTLPARVCPAQEGRDFEAPDLERVIHFGGVF